MRFPLQSVVLLSENIKTFGTSLALHAVAVAALGLIAVKRVVEPPPDFVDFEIVALEIPPPPALVEPAVVPEPEPEAEPVPEVARPPRVPDRVKVVTADKSRPFQRDSVASDEDAPEVEAVPVPTTPLAEISMESTVGGDGGGYVTTSSGGGTLGVRTGRGGGRGGGPSAGVAGPLANQGAVGVVASPDWVITDMPEPLNDGDFEPTYPVAARREKREAVVVLRLDIDADGRVVASEAVQGPRGHGFIKSAREYVSKLRFRPARAGDRRVATRIDWSVYFYVRN